MADGDVFEGIRAAARAFAESVNDTAARIALAFGGVDIRVDEALPIDRMMLVDEHHGPRIVFMHPIAFRMLRTGEDRTTATIGWTIDRAADRALARHERRCDAADARGEARYWASVGVHVWMPVDVSRRDYAAPGVEMTL
jgi:hypothetical protein